ncbi:MAG TPA: hypothetical protein VFE72_02130 [Lysobacter sp.]|nr:hypothetical protein [Lysobacter sp.]
MRVLPFALALAACAGCATTAPQKTASPAPVAAPKLVLSCPAPAKRDAFATWCDLPADVRAFVDDRDTCEEFRAAPWPSSESPVDRQRRGEIVEGLRTSCAGLERRLTELRQRHASNAPVAALLAAYQQR